MNGDEQDFQTAKSAKHAKKNKIFAVFAVQILRIQIDIPPQTCNNEKTTKETPMLKIREGKPIVTLETVCKNQDDVVVINGEAVLLVPGLV